jgi:tetratricopeptide (TPR) repeat protein
MFKEAEDSYMDALRIFEALHGDNDPTVAQIYGRLGETFGRRGLYTEEDKVRKEQLRIYRIVYGERSIGIAIALANMGGFLLHFGQYQEALEQW